MYDLLTCIGNKCFEHNKEYSGQFVGNPLTMRSPEECHSACKAKPSCMVFSFRNGRECVLMKSKGNVNPNNGVISGTRQDCPNERKSGKSHIRIKLLFKKRKFYNKSI